MGLRRITATITDRKFRQSLLPVAVEIRTVLDMQQELQRQCFRAALRKEEESRLTKAMISPEFRCQLVKVVPLLPIRTQAP